MINQMKTNKQTKTWGFSKLIKSKNCPAYPTKLIKASNELESYL